MRSRVCFWPVAKYDDASWHYGGDYPKGLAKKHGSTHIGFFLAWAFQRGMAGRLHAREATDDVAAVRAGKVTGAAFLRKNCDDKLTSDDLNADGNAFARARYTAYLKAYEKAVDPRGELESIYHAPDDTPTYRRVAKLLDQLHEAWARDRTTRRRKVAKLPAKRPAR